MLTTAVESCSIEADPPVLLDLGHIADVIGRAVARQGAHVAELADPAKVDRGCARALAVGRLWARRFALGSPPPGVAWGIADLLALVDDELRRMQDDGTLDGVPAEMWEVMLGGCRCDGCVVCRPPSCPRCGGSSACGAAG